MKIYVILLLLFLTFKYVFGIELKKDGVTRIIALGDSITNGVG